LERKEEENLEKWNGNSWVISALIQNFVEMEHRNRKFRFATAWKTKTACDRRTAGDGTTSSIIHGSNTHFTCLGILTGK
jgi:hypothetical protein